MLCFGNDSSNPGTIKHGRKNIDVPGGGQNRQHCLDTWFKQSQTHGNKCRYRYSERIAVKKHDVNQGEKEVLGLKDTEDKN